MGEFNIMAKVKKASKQMYYLIHSTSGKVVEESTNKAGLRRKKKEMKNGEKYKISKFDSLPEKAEKTKTKKAKKSTGNSKSKSSTKKAKTSKKKRTKKARGKKSSLDI